MNKVEIFEKEIGFIKNPQIKIFAEKAVDLLPDYFFSIPASSTGKYHPNYALGEGGLLRHTKAAVRIAVELFRTDLWKLSDDEKDMIIASLILHDGFKSGKIQEKYTKTEHPKIVVFEIMSNRDVFDLLTPEQQKMFVGNVETHMGKWVFDYKTNEQVLETPKTVSQRFTHLADYIASRKCLEFNFDTEITREEK